MEECEVDFVRRIKELGFLSNRDSFTFKVYLKQTSLTTSWCFLLFILRDFLHCFVSKHIIIEKLLSASKKIIEPMHWIYNAIFNADAKHADSAFAQKMDSELKSTKSHIEKE